jgi:hypothetical protein
MQRANAIWSSALFFAVAPTSLAGLVPWLITHWEFRPPFFDSGIICDAGVSAVG